jgi:hypothetical protein
VTSTELGTRFGKNGIRWGAVLKDAGIAALVALVLALPLFGARLSDGGGGGLQFRPWWVAIAVAAVFAGRAAIALWLGLRKPGTSAALPWFDRVVDRLSKHKRLLFAGFFLAVAILPLLPMADRRMVDLVTLGSILWSAWPVCSISATWPFTRSGPIPTPCWRSISI